MAELFATGRIVDYILLLMLVEWAALTLLRRITRRGLPALQLIVTLSAGAALLLALRTAMVGAPWQRIAPWLVAALFAHLVDLSFRLKPA